MAHSFESVLKQLGDEAQVVCGSIIIRRNNKNIEVSKYNVNDGGFVVTEEGLEVLDAAPVAPAVVAKSTTKVAA